MNNFLPEPEFLHDYQSKTAILLLNLGTPQAPTAQALRPYLKEFLSDRRVIEVPRLLWWFILNGVILNTRPAKSAEKYAAIWQTEGSPLYTHTRQQALLLQETLNQAYENQAGSAPIVTFAMRYGQPDVEKTLLQLRAQGVERILALPLYPQYAASASGSALDQVFRCLLKLRNMPEVRTIRHFHDHPAYIQALATQVRQHWQQHGQGDKLLMSFHGLPRFTLDKGDPYHCECLKTGRLLAEALELSPTQYQVCFQSRFGRTEWLKPYTSQTLEELGKQKLAKLDVICPGFVVDCLETLEEIAMEGKETFLTHGGGAFRYIPCLNDSKHWMQALTELSLQHLAGWETPPTSATRRMHLARAQGAKQ